jgi:hypothetical protein
VDGNVTLDLEQGRAVDQGPRLGVDGVGRESFRYGCDGAGLVLLLVGLLLGVVELDIALEKRNGRAVVGRALLHLLHEFLVFLLVWRVDDAPAAPPWHAGAETNTNPFLDLEP